MGMALPRNDGGGYTDLMTREDVFSKALDLPFEDRIRLVRDLLATLEAPADPDADRAWANEIERRIREVDDGTVQLIPWEEVRKRLESRLASRRH